MLSGDESKHGKTTKHKRQRKTIKTGWLLNLLRKGFLGCCTDSVALSEYSNYNYYFNVKKMDYCKSVTTV